MRRITKGAVVALTALTLALPALGKGVSEATITGPGADDPVVLGATLTEDRRALSELIDGIGFWYLAYVEVGDPNRPAITEVAPTTDLGPEYVVRVGHIGPAGTGFVDVMVYPQAVGGALAYVEPGVEVEEMRMETIGGWYASPADLATLLEGYGFDMTSAKATEATSAAEPTPVWLWAAPIGVTLILLVGAAGRRPRRLGAS